MKVKHIITTGGILLGGLALAQSASAVVTYKTSSDVQFTFNSTLTLSVEDDFVITDLAPDASKDSNEVDVVVSTNSAAGYTLSGTVGDSTYTDSNLTRVDGSTLDSSSVFTMTAGSLTTLASGTWGYLINSGTTYGALSTSTETTLNKTTNASGTGATGYDGGATTTMKIGARAASDQRSGDYKNVINFSAVANVAAHTITVAAGDNVASVTPATAASYDEGYALSISATCESGYDFVMWGNSTDYGVISDTTSASTTFNVGPADTTLTAYCE